jgi:hypothetical protein
MANELVIDYGITGKTIYALVLSSDGKIWNGSSFATIAAANWSAYAIAMSEQSTTGIYVGSFPAISAGTYGVSVRLRAGASPATTDAILGNGTMNWNGTAEKSLGASGEYTTAIAAIAGAVWANASRTLTQIAQEISASISGSTVTAIRGNSWEIELTDLTLGPKQQLALKWRASDLDAQALLMVDSVDGLTVLNGQPVLVADKNDASLDYTGTTLTLTVTAATSAQLPAGACLYGIQSVAVDETVSEAYGGSFEIMADIVRATK